MTDYVPSPLNEKYFTRQTSIEDIGIEGQLKLFKSKVVLLGLSAVGTAVVHGLLSAGIGKVHVIDNSVIRESDLGTNPTFSTNDIGRLKCIVLKERRIAEWSDNRVKLHSIKLSKQNADIVLPKDFDLAIATGYDPDEIGDFYELADERNFHIVGGTAIGWAGSFGIYTGNNEFYKQKTQAFLRQHSGIDKEISTSGSELMAGGLITNMALKFLLGNKFDQSLRFEFDMKNFTISSLHDTYKITKAE